MYFPHNVYLQFEDFSTVQFQEVKSQSHYLPSIMLVMFLKIKHFYNTQLINN